MAQVLIDLRIIQRYFSAQEEERNLIRNIYPELDWEDLRTRVLLSFGKSLEPIENFPVMHNGKKYILNVSITRA